jgi:hypothetical protein
MEKEYTKLSVFDFDGTLIETPTEVNGKIIYRQKTGMEWPHKGWWSKPETLDPAYFEFPVVKAVIEDYKREKSNPDTMVILLTGRIPKLSHLVENILDSHGLKFDGYYYNTGGSTDVSKVRTLNEILGQNKSIRSVELWDDRILHVPIFESWGKKLSEEGRLDNFSVNVIYSGNHD